MENHEAERLTDSDDVVAESAEEAGAQDAAGETAAPDENSPGAAAADGPEADAYEYAALRLGFWWEGTEPTGIVMIHEFGSTPVGVGRLAEMTFGAGFWTAAPVLPFHDGVLDGARLAETSVDGLVECIHEWRAAMQENAGSVILVGCGLGGSLALRAAADVPVAGVVTICTPFETFARRLRRVQVAKLFVGDVAGIGADVKRPGAQEPMIDRLPAEAFERMVEVEAAGREALADLTAPVLVLQSRDDHVVRARDRARVFERLTSDEKELAWLEHSYHRAWLDYDRDLIADRICSFAGALTSRRHALHGADADSDTDAQGPQWGDAWGDGWGPADI